MVEVVPLPWTHFSKALVNFQNQNQKNTGAWSAQVEECWSAEQELKLRPHHQPQVLKNLVRSYIAVTKTPFSVQTITSLSGEVKKGGGGGGWWYFKFIACFMALLMYLECYLTYFLPSHVDCH